MHRLVRLLSILLGVLVVLALAAWLGGTIVMTGRLPWEGQAAVVVAGPSPDLASPAQASPRPSATSAPSASAGPSASPTARPDPTARLVVVAEDFTAPLGVVTAGDGSGRLFVLEQGGLVRVVRDGSVERTPFLDLSGRISSGGERGLLGLAFHPRFPADPRIFADYTDPDGNTVVSSFRVADDGRGATVDRASERVLLRIEQPYPNHNGGHLVFGPDGFLYIGTGDGGLGGDPNGNGQKRDSLLGKILRIDVGGTGPGGRPYAIPAGNPFASGGGAPEIWAFGLRNPWRFDFDPASGDLWIGDVGQNTKEEIDVVRAGTPPPVNLGWNVTEADLCFKPSKGCDASGIMLPVAAYTHDAGCSVTGGVVARGEAAGSLDGRYLFSDFCTGTVWWLDPATAEPGRLVDLRVLLETKRSIASFGRDESGRVLLVDLAGGALLALEG